MLALATTAVRIPSPTFDWHVVVPSYIIVATTIGVDCRHDAAGPRMGRTSSIAAVGLLAALVLVATLAYSDNHNRSCSAVCTWAQ